MVIKKIIAAFLVMVFLQSCVVHSSVPFICFASGCVQNKKKNRAVAMKVKKGKVSKPRSSKMKGEIAKTTVKRKKTGVESSDGVKNWNQ